jgi:Flp pilus assembly protein TadG
MMRLATCNRRDRRGQAATELALALPIFLLVFVAVIEFSHLFYVRLTLEHALREAGRFMVTGKSVVDSDGNPVPRCSTSAMNAVEQIFQSSLLGTGSGLQSLTVTPADCGGPGQSVTLRAQFTKPFFTMMFDRIVPGGVPFDLSITWVNEPFFEES